MNERCRSEMSLGLIRPVWVPDTASDTCQECGVKFTFVIRFRKTLEWWSKSLWLFSGSITAGHVGVSSAATVPATRRLCSISEVVKAECAACVKTGSGSPGIPAAGTLGRPRVSMTLTSSRRTFPGWFGLRSLLRLRLRPLSITPRP